MPALPLLHLFLGFFLGDAVAFLDAAQELIALSSEHSYQYWVVHWRISLALTGLSAASADAEIERGLQEAAASIALMRSAYGSNLQCSRFLGWTVAACLEHGKAIEINSRPDRLDPPKRMLTVAVEAGCLFSIDTDAHAPGQLDWLRFGCERAALCGVPVERVVNAWPMDRLLEWTAGHK